MNNNRKSIFLILLLTFSLLPTSVSAEDSGRYAQYVSASPYEVGAGGTVEIEAMVTGTQYYDADESTRYNIWAESNNEETYTIALNIDAIEGMITYSWLVPESIPTGYYSICVEESDSGAESQHSVSCDSLNIIRYQIDMEVNNEIILPGETIRVWTTVSSPIDGSPEIPGTAGWEMRYSTLIDGFGSNSEPQVKSGVLTPASSHDFAVLMPSNLDPYDNLIIYFYANDSSGTQTSVFTKSVGVGFVETIISAPYYEQVISLQSDFLLQLNCKRSGYNEWNWMPEKNLALTVELEQGENKNSVSISSSLPGQPSNIMSDSDGHVSLLLAADNLALEEGAAELVVYWIDPSSGEEDNTSMTVYLSTDDSEPLDGVGIQIIIDGPRTSSEPGQEIIMTVNTLDMAGNPLPGIWVHYLTSRSTESGGDDRSKWTIQQSDNHGKLTVVLTIPADLNPAYGSITLVVKAKNETGIADEVSQEVRLIEPKISLYPSTMSWLPGDEVEMKISAEDMTGNVVVFWSVEELDLDGQLTFAADSQGSFSFTVPERESQDMDDIRVHVVAIDSSGETDESYYYVSRLTGHSLMVTPPSGVIIAGEIIALSYVLSPMDPTIPNEYPMQYTVSIVGVVDSPVTGFVNDASGSIEYTVPSYLVSGSYLFIVNLEQQGSYIPLEVRSSDDAAGVSGTFSSVADSLDSASGWVSTLALVLAFACLLLLLKRGGKKEKEWSSFNEPLPLANQITTSMPPPPPPPPSPAAIPEYDPTSPTGYAQPPQY